MVKPAPDKGLDKLARYEKILARALRGEGEERAAAKRLLAQMEAKYPKIREQYLARAARSAGERKATSAAGSVRSQAEAWAGQDLILRTVVAAGQEHLSNVISAVFDVAEQGLVDLLSGVTKMPSNAEPSTEDLLEEYGSVEVQLDEEDDIEIMIVEFAVPREVWGDRKALFAWLRTGVDECLAEIDSEDEDEDDEDDDDDFNPDDDDDDDNG